MMKSLKIRTPYQILFGLSNRGDGRDKCWVERSCVQGVWGEGEITEKESTWKTQA